MDLRIKKVKTGNYFEYHLWINQEEPVICKTWKTVVDVLTIKVGEQEVK